MIYLGSDHAGFKVKEKIKQWLKEWGLEYEDIGPFVFDAEDDYPDFAHILAQRVAEDPEHNRGIMLGGSGQGEAMAPNRHKGVRAAVYYGGSLEIVKLSRTHNNANVLGVGTRFIDEETLKHALKLWFETPFPDPFDRNSERHIRRINKIDQDGPRI
jgi:ribose 5-phosphate isomerase B